MNALIHLLDSSPFHTKTTLRLIKFFKGVYYKLKTLLWDAFLANQFLNMRFGKIIIVMPLR